MVRDDQLALLEKFVGHAYDFSQQSSRILPQIEDKAFQIAHLIESFGDFMLGRFLESGNVHVTDAGLDHEVQVHAVARNLVADYGKFEGLVGAFAQHRDADSSAFRSLKQIGNVGGAHVVGGLAVDGGNNVARPDSGAIGRCADEGSDDNNFVVARADRHAHAVILAALFFA